MSEARDPRNDPRTGDTLTKEGISGTLTRKVVFRDGNTVYYTTKEGGHVHRGWVMSWREWALTASAQEGQDTETEDRPRRRKVSLG